MVRGVEDMLKLKLLFVLIPAALVLACDVGSNLPAAPTTRSNDKATGGPEGAASAASSRLVEIEGRVESVTAPDVVVRVRRQLWTVRTTIATRIEKDDRRITLAQILPGDQVEVEGVLLADGSLLAREIEVEGEDPDENEVEFTGTIESITGNVLVISGRTVIVTSSTVIKKDGVRIRVDQLLIGDRVEVEGVRLADGTILAAELEVRDEEDEDDNDDDQDDDDDDEDDDDDDDDEDDDSDD